jgi:hypothetical protein
MKSITTFTLLAIGAGLLAAAPARAQEEPASPSDRPSIQRPRTVDGIMRFENRAGHGVLIEIYSKSGKFEERKTLPSMKADSFSFSGDAGGCQDSDHSFKILRISDSMLMASGAFGFESKGALDCILQLRNQSNKEWPTRWQLENEDKIEAVVEFGRISPNRGFFRISRE